MKSVKLMDPVVAAMNALTITKDATIGEKLIIFCDPEQQDLGKMYSEAGIKLGLWTRLVILDAGQEVREAPDNMTKEIITSSNPDLIINVFRKKDEETSYRIQFMRLERRRAERILHCPGNRINDVPRSRICL